MLSLCVGAVLYRDGQVLLGLRSKTKQVCPGTWDVIGGHVEPGESIHDALIRELREELGIRPIDFETLAVYQLPEPPAAARERYHVFAVRSWDGEPRNASDEHDEIRWFPIDQLDGLRLADVEYIRLFAALR